MAKDQPVTIQEFRLNYGYIPSPKRNWRKIFRDECTCTKNTLRNLFPILTWLQAYQAKRDLLGDILSGLTVAIMHIPHGLAYSQLGGVPPVVGLYMAIFPLFVYIVMGTSRHISIGTFAVLCAMVGNIVLQNTQDVYQGSRSMSNSSAYTSIEVATGVCLVVGLWQLLLALLRLGALIVFFSNALVSGFTTGAACHVLTYQFKNLLGINVTRFSGPHKLIYIYVDLFRKVPDTNLVTLTISICFLGLLLSFNCWMRPLIIRKYPKCRLLVPIELIAVILGILLSYFLKLNEDYDVDIVAEVPTGLPTPSVPPFELLPRLVVLSFPVAVVAVAINLSLAKIFSKKGGYKISGKQEILAYGFANIFACFFQCLPTAASLSRSIVQYTSGGKTQLASVFSSGIMILILLFIGTFFEPIPYCVLSSIVVASVVGLLLQVRDLPKMWRQSYFDGGVWLVTFLSVIIIDIDYGLLIGFVASVASLTFLNHWPQLVPQGKVDRAGLYLDLAHFGSANEIPNVVVVEVIGSLNFANDHGFQEKIVAMANAVELDPDRKHSAAVILNLAGVSYIDPTAANGLVTLEKDLLQLGFHLLLSCCNVKVYENLERAETFAAFSPDRVFASTEDAVNFSTTINAKKPE